MASEAAALAMTAVALAACVVERDAPVAACPTWKDDVGPALAERCAGCHAGAAPAGGVSLDEYAGALVADGGAALAAALTAEASLEAHRAASDLAPLLARWAGECEVAYLRSPLHPGGLMDPRSAEFHGAELRVRGWDLGLCRSCHGGDFAGGSSGASCRTCHERGPTACDTCHAMPPPSGAHAAHASQPCSGCHAVPARWDDPGHLRGVDGAVDPAPAEVALTGLAAATPVPGERDGAPAFDPATGRCAGVYCHGDATDDAAATATRPTWTGGAAQAACGTCHGAPPAGHAWTSCATCHPVGPDDAAHVDGVVDVGRTAGCDGCHGQGPQGGPGPALDGATSTLVTAVGAHEAHRAGRARIAGAIGCDACHVVPATVGAPGHLDTPAPAEVRPAAGWDAAAGTCAGGCHGDGRPRWTAVGVGEVTCGSCHGVPPASHAPDLALTACAACHPATMDATGAILRAGPPGAETSHHLDGDVDL